MYWYCRIISQQRMAASCYWQSYWDTEITESLLIIINRFYFLFQHLIKYKEPSLGYLCRILYNFLLLLLQELLPDNNAGAPAETGAPVRTGAPLLLLTTGSWTISCSCRSSCRIITPELRQVRDPVDHCLHEPLAHWLCRYTHYLMNEVTFPASSLSLLWPQCK